jgi:starvation-inducible DNA-binding protein
MAVKIGMKEEAINGVVRVLSKVQADEMVLYQKLRGHHWNVYGTLFLSVHETTEEQYNQLAIVIDDVAERITSYGKPAVATLAAALELARIEEKEDSGDTTARLRDMVAAHEKMVELLREDAEKCGNDFGDAGAEDLLVGLLQKHQMMAWKLRSFL